MSLERTTKSDELIQVWIPKRKMDRSIPLKWGILTIVLFTCFIVSSQLQLRHLAEGQLSLVKTDVYNNQLVAYRNAVKANADCLLLIENNETDRKIFKGIADMFDDAADLPASLLPDSAAAKRYQELLKAQVISNITDPVNSEYVIKDRDACPKVPDKVPDDPNN